MENQNPKKIETKLVSQSFSYSGPLPTSAEFAGYERTLPGTAERILIMTEEEAVHRRAKETKIIDKSLKIAGQGQIFAFCLALASLAIVTVSILLDKPLVAIVPAVIALTSLAAVFVKK